MVWAKYPDRKSSMTDAQFHDSVRRFETASAASAHAETLKRPANGRFVVTEWRDKFAVRRIIWTNRPFTGETYLCSDGRFRARPL